jgi:hypothetical protein
MVYFARMVGRGPIKIGCTSKKVAYRIVGLEYEYGVKFRLLAVIDGGFAEEKALHRRFAKLRYRERAKFGWRRELFHADKELMDFIKGLSLTPRPSA